MEYWIVDKPSYEYLTVVHLDLVLHLSRVTLWMRGVGDPLRPLFPY